jgi:hypothetical protein
MCVRPHVTKLEDVRVRLRRSGEKVMIGPARTLAVLFECGMIP